MILSMVGNVFFQGDQTWQWGSWMVHTGMANE